MNPPRPGEVPGPRLPVRMITAAGVLAAGVVTWSAFPLGTAEGGLRVALLAAIAGGALSVAQLAVTHLGPARQSIFESLADRLVSGLVAGVAALPWAEFMTIAVVVMEALHPARPAWHTALLAAALLAYLLAVHLAETRARIGVLRAQLPLIIAGLCLTALSIGAAKLPGLSSGLVAAVVTVIAAIACVAAAALVIPVWLGRGR